jgi:hypothetical protein
VDDHQAADAVEVARVARDERESVLECRRGDECIRQPAIRVTPQSTRSLGDSGVHARVTALAASLSSRRST